MCYSIHPESEADYHWMLDDDESDHVEDPQRVSKRRIRTSEF